MKTLHRIIALALSALFVCGLCACEEEGEVASILNDELYEDELETSASFSFSETGLTQESLYPVGSGTTYYVSDRKGDDARYAGTSAQEPFESIDKVNEMMAAGEIVAGDSVLFCCGDNFKGTLSITVSGTQEEPITFASYCDDERYADRPPRLYNRNADVITFTNVSNIVIRDLNVQVQSVQRTSSDPVTIPTGIAGYYTVEYPSVVWEGEESAPEDGTPHGGTPVLSGDAPRCENIYIVNNRVSGGSHLFNNRGICIWSVNDDFNSCPDGVLSNVRIVGNTVSRVGRSGIVVHAWLDRSDTTNHNNAKQDLYRGVLLDGNTVFDIGQIGMYIGCCSESGITRNTVYNTGMYPVDYSYAEGNCGIMVIASKDVDVAFNETYNNFRAGSTIDAMGIDIDWNTDDVRVTYNHCYDNDGSGIGTMANSNCVISGNRIENNRCITNNRGQISVSNFTARYYAVADTMHSVKNLQIVDNLIVYTGDDPNVSMFYTIADNGDLDWSGNAFSRNHVVTYNDTDEFYIRTDGTRVPWNAFSDNCYYGEDTLLFTALDGTSAANIANGGSSVQETVEFSVWQTRDVGSTYEEVSLASPDAVQGVSAVWENGALTASWQAASGSVWHYNIYLCTAGDAVDYTKLQCETQGTSAQIPVAHAGEYFLIVQPESPCGVYGQAVKIAVTLG